MSEAALELPHEPDVFARAQRMVPAHWTVQRVGEMVCMSPRPRSIHSGAEVATLAWAQHRFGEKNPDRRGPGGWRFLLEPELSLGDDVLVPDLAGWRIERMPTLPDVAVVTLVPDWVCEVLSPSTETFDRGVKAPAYARRGVPSLWLVDPKERLVEVFQCVDGRMVPRALLRGEQSGSLEPFGGAELAVAQLWG